MTCESYCEKYWQEPVQKRRFPLPTAPNINLPTTSQICSINVTNSSDGLIFVKRRALFLAKIRALDGRKDGQNSSFARLLLRSATPLRVQSAIELSKNLTNPLNVF